MKETKSSPTTMILFGATGDLSRKKIIPAIFNLYQKKRLPEKFKILGFSRRDLSRDDFQKIVAEALQKSEHVRGAPTKENMASFLELFFYRINLAGSF